MNIPLLAPAIPDGIGPQDLLTIGYINEKLARTLSHQTVGEIAAQKTNVLLYSSLDKQQKALNHITSIYCGIPMESFSEDGSISRPLTKAEDVALSDFENNVTDYIGVTEPVPYKGEWTSPIHFTLRKQLESFKEQGFVPAVIVVEDVNCHMTAGRPPPFPTEADEQAYYDKAYIEVTAFLKRISNRYGVSIIIIDNTDDCNWHNFELRNENSFSYPPTHETWRLAISAVVDPSNHDRYYPYKTLDELCDYQKVSIFHGPSSVQSYFLEIDAEKGRLNTVGTRDILELKAPAPTPSHLRSIATRADDSDITQPYTESFFINEVITHAPFNFTSTPNLITRINLSLIADKGIMIERVMAMITVFYLGAWVHADEYDNSEELASEHALSPVKGERFIDNFNYYYNSLMNDRHKLCLPHLSLKLLGQPPEEKL